MNNSSDGRASDVPTKPDFLAGGGEMGARIRAYDWSATPLGAPSTWPQSLRTVIGIMLSSRYQMWMGWGPELTFFCNDAYLPTVGAKQSWVLGARSDKVWAEIWADIGPRIQHVLATGEATWDEDFLALLERHGFPEETYHTFSYSPLADDGGRITGMLCVVTEETERVIGERRLASLRDLGGRLAGALSCAEVIHAAELCLALSARDMPFALLYLIDGSAPAAKLATAVGIAAGHKAAPALLSVAGGSSVWPVAEALSGLAPVEVDGLGARGLGTLPSGPWHRPPHSALVVPIAQQGQRRPIGVFIAGLNPHRPLDPAYRGYLVLFVGQIAAALASADAYEAERRRAQALAEIDRAKTAFFSNVSHEFRTPLTLMLGPIEELLADGTTQGQTRERLELARRNALRLQKLVNSLLDFSRIEAGRVQASFEPTDLAALTRDLASTFRSAIECAGLSFTVACPALSGPVYVDRDMWEKIVLNLLSNAFKFTLSGGIDVRLGSTATQAVLEVGDTGVGVPASELPRLFERFYRVEGGQGRTHEGSGIGLALVQELVRLHGGTIEAASELGRGTLFRIQIPLGSAHLPAERIAAPRSLAATADAPEAYVQEALRWLPDASPDDASTPHDVDSQDLALDPRLAATAGARIVLADDNADMRGYLRGLLSRHYAVEAVSDGVQALEAAQRDRPDLLISDVMMPRLDGFGLVQRLRADAALRGIPVILLSARAGEESRIEGLGTGADDYLVKPFSARELLARVGACLALTRVRQQAAEAIRAGQERVAAQNVALVHANRIASMGRLAASISHEVNQPLAAAAANASAALNFLNATPPDLDEVRTLLGRIVSNAERAGRIIGSIRDLTKRAPPQKGRLDCTAVIRGVIELIGSEARKNSVLVQMQLVDNLPPVQGDSVQLQQVILNLAINAIEAMSGVSERARELVIGAGQTASGEVLVAVRDSGPGLAPAALDRLLDGFYTTKPGGMGLGLSISRSIIEAHGGRLWASANEPCGAVFQFTLPVDPDAAS